MEQSYLAMKKDPNSKNPPPLLRKLNHSNLHHHPRRRTGAGLTRGWRLTRPTAQRSRRRGTGGYTSGGVNETGGWGNNEREGRG